MKNKKLIVGVTAGISALSFLRGQLAWFSEKDWDVILVADPDENSRKAAIRENVRFEGISMERNISPWADLKALLKWMHVIRFNKPYAVNIGTPKASLLGIVAAFALRVPKRLYVVRGLRLEGASGSTYLLLWIVEKLIMLLSTDVFFVSRSLAIEAGRRRLLTPKKSWLIGDGSSNGVPATLIAETVEKVDKNALRAKIGIQPDDFVVGFVGRINRDKGIRLLIEALESSDIDPKVKALFIGGVEDKELTTSLENLGNKVVLIPWVENPWEYFPLFDILCLPSLREGFPNVVLEAASVAIPSVVTSATGTVDSVINGRTGVILEDRDSNELVKVINCLADDRDLVERLGAEAKTRAINEFSPDRIWRGLLEILEGEERNEYAKRILE